MDKSDTLIDLNIEFKGQTIDNPVIDEVANKVLHKFKVHKTEVEKTNCHAWLKKSTKGKFVMSQDDHAEFFGQLIDVFEDFLEERGIDVPNPEKEEDENLEDAAIIFGSDYDCLKNDLERTLSFWDITFDHS